MAWDRLVVRAPPGTPLSAADSSRMWSACESLLSKEKRAGEDACTTYRRPSGPNEKPRSAAVSLRLAVACNQQIREEEERRENEVLTACAGKPPAQIGMTPEEAIASRWGRPYGRRRYTDASGTREEWIYDEGAVCLMGRRGVLTFVNGRLAAIQD